jgi:hypothetical protein
MHYRPNVVMAQRGIGPKGGLAGFRHPERGEPGAIIAPLVEWTWSRAQEEEVATARREEPGRHVMAITWPNRTNQQTAVPMINKLVPRSTQRRFMAPTLIRVWVGR